MYVPVHLFVIFWTWCIGSVCLYKQLDIEDTDSLHRLGCVTHERNKRAMSLAELGAAAIRVLIRGATEVPTRSRYYTKFTKPGTLQTAISDFRSIAKSNNRKLTTPDGAQYYEGLIGDKSVRLNINDKIQHGKPTILVYDAKPQGQFQQQVKVVYDGPKTDYSIRIDDKNHIFCSNKDLFFLYR